MPEPFERRAGQGAVSRLFGRASRASAVREIEDLLARAEHCREVSPTDVKEIADRHGVDLSKRLGTQRRSLYRRFLEHCLLDCELSETESLEIEHLRELLLLTGAEAAEVHETVARDVYGKAIDRVLEDHRLDPGEEEFLRRLCTQLELSAEEAARIEQEATARARHRYLERSASYDNVWLASAKTVLELRGGSPSSVEDAVRDALDEASQALPDLRWAEVTEIRVAVGSGGSREWRVRLRAGLSPDESEDAGGA